MFEYINCNSRRNWESDTCNTMISAQRDFRYVLTIIPITETFAFSWWVLLTCKLFLVYYTSEERLLLLFTLLCVPAPWASWALLITLPLQYPPMGSSFHSHLCSPESSYISPCQLIPLGQSLPLIKCLVPTVSQITSTRVN